MLKVYIAESSKVCASDARLSARRREKIARLRSEEQKKCSAAVELLLMHALGASEPLEYYVNQNGKPYFPDGNIHFSLSHSGSYAACAIADRPLGVDIEKPREGSLRLAKRFFAPDEQAEAADDLSFCRIWVKKESYIKAADKTLASLPDFSVVGGIAGYAFADTQFKDFCLGLCVEGEIEEFEIIEVEL